jgi:hypothetical protein
VPEGIMVKYDYVGMESYFYLLLIASHCMFFIITGEYSEETTGRESRAQEKAATGDVTKTLQ